jgi:hypothetical protein
MARDYPTSKTRSATSRRVLRRAAGVAEGLESLAKKPVRLWRTKGFPYRAPSIPLGVEVPEKEGTLGADFDTDFARTPAARFAARRSRAPIVSPISPTTTPSAVSSSPRTTTHTSTPH